MQQNRRSLDRLAGCALQPVGPVTSSVEFNYQDSSDDHDKDGNANQTQGFHAFERQVILFSVAYKCSLN